MPDVAVEYAELPASTGGALLARCANGALIVLDERLSKTERRCRLAHELVHLERGTSTRCRWASRMWLPLVVREELAVDRIVADRLVPADLLVLYVDRQVDLGRGVTAAMVAEEFDVVAPVASIALDRLRVRRAG